MSPLALAWRSLTRQPARAWLGIAGIAIVGALLFDMLLLSRGLAISFRELLDEVGFDVRVTANRAFPARGPRIAATAETLKRLASLPEVEQAIPVRFGRAEVVRQEEIGGIDFLGVGGPARRTWTVRQGTDLPVNERDGLPPILVNPEIARILELAPGSTLRLRGACSGLGSALPAVDFEVVGIAEFIFNVSGGLTSVTTLPHMLKTCAAPDPDSVDFIFVASGVGHEPEDTVLAIQQALPDLHTFSNQEFVDRLQATDFSYFRQISFALSTITLFFAFLLIATLLTVSVNQRLGEVAALRALGFRRSRVVADLMWESAALVLAGGLLALPLGGLLAYRLDAILRTMPGIPSELHFFVFQPRAVAIYAVLLLGTGLLASLYPVYLAARLPIAATLRREVVG